VIRAAAWRDSVAHWKQCSIAVTMPLNSRRPAAAGRSLGWLSDSDLFPTYTQHSASGCVLGQVGNKTESRRGPSAATQLRLRALYT
jgi:hypothetical protein